MTRRPRFATLALTLLTLLVASVPGCGKNSTNPPGGGGAAKELDSGTLGPGAMYAHMFATVGTYNYHCNIHGLSMAGTVTVAGGQPANAAVSIVDNAYNPASVSVAPGGTVTWTRNGSNPHTVTSN
jgi:plastocyanin